MNTSFEIGKKYLIKSGYIHRNNTPVKIIKKTAKMLSFEFLDTHTMSGIDTIRVVKVSYIETHKGAVTRNTDYGYLDTDYVIN